MATTDQLLNTFFDGRYQVVRKLGAGGMANVYLAEDQELGRGVAIKILNDRHANDEQFVERFRREAKNAAALSHPNIVSIYDRGEAEGTYYIAMEYLDGRSLKELIVSRGPAPVGVAVEYARQILSALRFAHRHGIVHRDIKPHNVLVDGEGRVKVTDFGIARAGASQMTEAGSIVGTAQYLSPEQARGGDVDQRSDLYSLGVLMYEMLTAPRRAPGGAVSPPVPPSVYYDLDEPIHRRPVWPWIAALLFVIGAGIGGWFLYHQISSKLNSTTPIAVRNYVDENEQNATSNITADGFNPVVKHHTSLTTPAGLVYQQDPPAGHRQPKGNDVTILVSTGIPKVEIPTMKGLKSEDAIAKLKALHLVPDVHDNASSLPADEVTASDPKAGTQVVTGTKVRINVSSGPTTAPVPNVVGKSLSEATSTLNAAGFKVSPTFVESDQPQNQVVNQSPSEAAQGSTIALTVSKGPKTVAVPDVRTLDVGSATSTLQDQGFKVKFTYTTVTDPNQDQIVLDQSPE